MKLRHIFAYPIVALLAVPALGWGQETERVHKVMTTGPTATIGLKNFSGEVRITGTDGNDVVIDAVRSASADRLKHIKLDIEQTGSTIRIEANKRESSWDNWGRDNVVRTEFDLKVPRDARLDLSVFSSPVSVHGVTGAQTLHGFSSHLTLDGVAAPVEARTFSGQIEVELAAGNARPDLNLHTFSGNIDVRLPSQAAGNVDFHSFSGDLTSDLPLTLESKSRHNLSARLNGGGSELRFNTFSGDVRLKR